MNKLMNGQHVKKSNEPGFCDFCGKNKTKMLIEERYKPDKEWRKINGKWEEISGRDKIKDWPFICGECVSKTEKIEGESSGPFKPTKNTGKETNKFYLWLIPEDKKEIFSKIIDKYRPLNAKEWGMEEEWIQTKEELEEILKHNFEIVFTYIAEHKENNGSFNIERAKGGRGIHLNPETVGIIINRLPNEVISE